MGTGYSIKAKSPASADIYIYEDVGESWFGGVSAKRVTDLSTNGPVAVSTAREPQRCTGPRHEVDLSL